MKTAQDTAAYFTGASAWVTAKYAALTFFQGQAQRPLTDEEIVEVSTKVNNEVGEYTKDLIKMLSDGGDVG